MTSFTIATAESSSVKGHIVANVQIHANFVRVAAEHNVDVVVFPELSLTGYEPELAGGLILTPEDARLHLLHELSRRHDITIMRVPPSILALISPTSGPWFSARLRLTNMLKSICVVARKSIFHPVRIPVCWI